MTERYEVVVAAGSLRSEDPTAWQLPHRWTPEGVTVEAAFTGAHLLHVAVAGCVLNDTYREAAGLGFELGGIRVRAGGEYADDWTTVGVAYEITVDASLPADDLQHLLAAVDDVAEIPKAVRAGGRVSRVEP